MAYAPASAFQRALPSPLSPPSCPCSCSKSPLQLQPLVGLPFRNPKYHAHEQRFKVISRAGAGILSEGWDVTAASFGGFSPSQMDPTSVLLGQRIIFLGSQVDDLSADVIISQLLLLDAEDPAKDIKLLINSPGGSVTAGMGIYDAMKLCRADVSTICFGLAASMGAFLLASGTRGKRYCMPNARVMIHQPLGGAGGSAIDIGLQVREMMYHKIKLNKILSRLTGKPEKQIEIDTDRDNFMNAWEAVEYGLIDAVIDDGKPGLVAPIGEAIEPPKTQVWKYWMIREGRERKVMPSEDIITKEGKKDKDQSQPEKKETAAI